MICESRGSVKSRFFLHLPLGHAEVAMQRSCVGIMLPRQSGTRLLTLVSYATKSLCVLTGL